MAGCRESAEVWEAIGRKWVEAGHLWEAQDAYERVGKVLTAEQLIAIGDRCVEAGKLDEAHAAYELGAVGRRMHWHHGQIEHIPEAQPILSVADLAVVLGVSSAAVKWMYENGLLPRRTRWRGNCETAWARSTIYAWLSAGSPPRADWDRIKQLTPQFAD
jgi:predicted DNA-binding transcriptional regulator AlpA